MRRTESFGDAGCARSARSRRHAASRDPQRHEVHRVSIPARRAPARRNLRSARSRPSPRGSRARVGARHDRRRPRGRVTPRKIAARQFRGSSRARMHALLGDRFGMHDHQRQADAERRALPGAAARGLESCRRASRRDAARSPGQGRGPPRLARRSPTSAWRKRSKTCGRKSGAMPMPVSLTDDLDVRVDALEPDLHPAAASA